MSSNATAVAQCFAVEPTGPPDQLPTSTVAINGVSFTVFHLSDAGAGNIYETTGIAPCMRDSAGRSNIQIHSSEDQDIITPEYGLVPFDEVKLHDVLDRIVGTFTFSKP